MARPKVIIADEDANYIVPLQFKFVTDFFNKIDLEIITDRAYFDDYFSKPQNAEILIVSEELYDSFLQRHNIQNIFVMMEQYDEGGTGELNVNQIFKYTSIKEIFNEIIGKSAGALNVAAVEKKETQIILVTSAAGGVGKTTVAMGVAACLVQNYKRVLYIEAASLQSAQYMLENDTPISSPDIYTKLLNPSDSIYADIKHVIRKEVFSYIPPFKAAIMSVGLSKNIYMDIAVSAKKSGEYDYIVVDTDSVFDEFKADKEYERVQNIQKYVTSCNERYVGMNARVIPEIPKCLDIGYVEKHYAQANTNDELMIGLDYETIEPLSMNLNENDMIVLSGKKDVSRKAFAKYIISVFADKKFGKTELYVLDTLAGKWGELEILPQTAYYTTDADSSISIVTEIGQIVEQRYQNYINRRSNLQDESWIVVIVDNNDAILALSSNKNAMATLKDIWGKYSGMKVIFVFTDINNASIPFNAPEIMKIIKERKKYIIFDEISNIKTTDIPLSLTRKYSKPLETGDAYLVEDGDVKKIRTIN